MSKLEIPTGKCDLLWNEELNQKDYNEKGSNTHYYHTGNGWVVIDIDSLTIPQEMTALLGKLKPTTKTARGTHYYFYHDADIEYINKQHLGKDNNIDIRGKGGKIFYQYDGDSEHIGYDHKPKNIYNLNEHSLVKIWLDDVALKKYKTPTQERGDVGQMGKKEVKRLVSKLNILDFKSEFDWKKVLASIYHAGGDDAYKIAKKWSKGDPDEYREKDFNIFWDRLVTGDFGEDISAGTLYHLAGEKVDRAEFFSSEKGSVKPMNMKEKKKIEKDPLALFDDIMMTDDDYKKIKKQKFYIKGFIPNEGLFMFAGDSGTYKSWLSFALAQQVMQEHHKTKTVFIDIDAGAVYSKQRVQRLRSTFDDRFRYVSQFKSDAGEVISVLKELLKYDLGDTIIVMDSLSSFTDGKVNDGGDNKLTSILTLCEELRNRHALVILIHHIKKKQEKDHRPVYAGSYMIKKTMDVLCLVEKSSTNEILLTIDKGRGDYADDRAYKIDDFESMSMTEVNAVDVSQTMVEKEVENKKAIEAKVKYQEDKALIDDIKAIIKDRVRMYKEKKNDAWLPIQSRIEADAKRDMALGQKAVVSLLRKYNDKEWTWERYQPKTGRSTKLYKLIKKG